MAKEKRFPSDANRQKPGFAPKELSKPEAKTVSGSKQELVQVEYKKENHHLLPKSVHHLSKGINHLPKSVWEEHKKDPAIAHLLKEGHIVEVETGEAEPKEDGVEC